MINTNYYDVYDVCNALGGVSKTYAYGVIRKLNLELESKGYITIAGKISKKYFNERIYGNILEDED